jgi:hypothetical protein
MEAYVVYRLAMSLKVRGSDPVGAKFHAPVQTGPRVHQASYRVGTGSFQKAKPAGRGVNYPPHQAPRLNKECSYYSTPPLAIIVLL